MIEESVETQDKRKLSKLAVIALFFSIVGPLITMIDHEYVGHDPNPYWYGLAVICICGFLIAPLVAIAALFDIRRKKEGLKGKGVATSAIVLTVIAHILLLPLHGAMKPYARNFQRCQTNLNALAVTFTLYAGDHDGRWPSKEKWCDQILESNEIQEDTFHCPADREGMYSYADIKGMYSYAMNVNLPESMEDTPEDMVLLFECIPGKNAVGGPELAVTDRHQELRKTTEMSEPGCNVVLSYGEIIFVKPEEIKNLKWKIEKE